MYEYFKLVLSKKEILKSHIVYVLLLSYNIVLHCILNVDTLQPP